MCACEKEFELYIYIILFFSISFFSFLITQLLIPSFFSFSIYLLLFQSSYCFLFPPPPPLTSLCHFILPDNHSSCRPIDAYRERPKPLFAPKSKVERRPQGNTQASLRLCIALPYCPRCEQIGTFCRTDKNEASRRASPGKSFRASRSHLYFISPSCYHVALVLIFLLTSFTKCSLTASIEKSNFQLRVKLSD